MTIEQLGRLVERMRKAQRAYFNTRTQAALAESKALEREVDLAIKTVLSPPQQESLL